MTKNKEDKKLKRSLQGIVTKFSNENTVKVEVESKFPHPLYGKIIKRHKQYLVHIEKKVKDLEIGDEVIIEESRPISKNKSWKLVKKVK